MELNKMKAKTLSNWIARLEMCLKLEQDPGNIERYKKWLAEAREEQKTRLERKQAYLYCKEKGMFQEVDMEKIKKDFTEEEINAIREYEEILIGLVQSASKLLKYPNSRLGDILDKLYDAIGDAFPFEVEL